MAFDYKTQVVWNIAEGQSQQAACNAKIAEMQALGKTDGTDVVTLDPPTNPVTCTIVRDWIDLAAATEWVDFLNLTLTVHPISTEIISPV